MNLRRVWIIYRKELLEALRDRRTLIAMVLVPLLLYPVLMVVVVQALQVERSRQERATYRIAVPDNALRRWFVAILAADAPTTTTSQPEEAAAATSPRRRARVSGTQFEIVVVEGALDESVRGGNVQLAVTIEPPPPKDALGGDVNRTVKIYYDPSEVRSEVAMRSMQLILDRQSQRFVTERLKKSGLNNELLVPLRIAEVSVASPARLGGALLGQILPFLLVIMTVTGAIYPAIDLTAGERERGTLETLMVAPVPRTQIMAGKFLVVTTVAITSSALNLISMGATMRFTGIAEAMSAALPNAGPVVIPVQVLPIVLAAMVPFAVLFSAVMLATCSFARTFKEAQNYMTPVMIAALIPAMIMSYMPSVRLAGPITVIPVANVVVMLRELFVGRFDVAAMAVTFGSTCFYAAAAVLVAAKLYGQEAVLFSDVGSYRSLLSRRLMRPAPRPGVAMAVLLTAVIFPLSFFWQTSLTTPDMSPQRLAGMTISLMLLCYLLPPLVVAWYTRLDLRETFSLRPPSARSWLGTCLVAATAPVLSVALAHLVTDWLPQSQEVLKLMSEQEHRMLALPTVWLLFTVALLPAVCEEMAFRGFLQAGLKASMRPVWLCVAVGLVFGLFHADLWRIPTTTVLGIVLTAACYRSGSIFPAMLIHLANNASALLSTQHAWLARYLGAEQPHSAAVVVGAGVASVVGLALMSRRSK